MARFDVVYTFGYKSAESEPWSTLEYIVPGWPWQVLDAMHAVVRAGEPCKNFFC